MLIRCRPHGPGAAPVIAQVTDWVENRVPGLLFFHGAGVAWVPAVPAAAVRCWRDAGVDLMVCSAAWQRRHREPLPDGWLAGSLIQFWDAAERAEQVLSAGSLADA